MHVCVCVRVCVCVFVCVCEWVLCQGMRPVIPLSTIEHTHPHRHARTHTHRHTDMHPPTQACTHAHTQAHRHAPTHTGMHAHTYLSITPSFHALLNKHGYTNTQTETRSFFLYGHRTFMAPVQPLTFLTAISKLLSTLQHNTDVYNLVSAAVDLFDWFFVGTFRLSSHARPL